MSPIKILPCTVSDAAELSYNNISAFWEDPTWRLSWQHTTLEKHIETTSKRYPRRLISDREVSRHQKAVDADTGCLVGYARWDLPPAYAAAWPEAIVPPVAPDEETEIRRVAAATPFNPNTVSDPLDVAIGNIKKDILARNPLYINLDYLAVHPNHQGKGIATALVKSGIEQATKIGLDVFVMAFRPAWGVYDRLGFRVEQELIQDDTVYGGPGNFAVRFMVYKQPNPESEIS